MVSREKNDIISHPGLQCLFLSGRTGATAGISVPPQLNTGMPYISNFKTQKVLKEVISYTADKTCMVYVQCVSNNKLYGTIIVRVGEYYVFQWQNATAQENLTYGILIALQEGDTINTYGTGIKTSNFYVHD